MVKKKEPVEGEGVSSSGPFVYEKRAREHVLGNASYQPNGRTLGVFKFLSKKKGGLPRRKGEEKKTKRKREEGGGVERVKTPGVREAIRLREENRSLIGTWSSRPIGTFWNSKKGKRNPAVSQNKDKRDRKTQVGITVTWGGET